MTPYARLFGILFAIFAVIWAICYIVVYMNPSVALVMSMPLMLCGWGTGIFFILFIVMFVLKR